MGALNFCEGCGIQINSDSRFCKSCSKKMTEKAPIPETSKVLDPFSGSNEKTAPNDEFYIQAADEHLDYLSTDINSELFQDPSVDDFSQNEKSPHPVPEKTSNTTQPISVFKALRKIAKVLFIVIVSILACVSGIIIILFWLLYSWVENQNSGIRNQLEALSTGKIEKAYSYMSKDFQANTQLAAFSIFLNEHPQLMTNESPSFISNSQHDDLGKVIAKLKSKGGVETQVEYHLKKEDGEWKIVSIKVLP